MAVSQTQITDLPTLSYTTTSKIPTLSGYYREYPPPPGLCLEVESRVVKKENKPLGYAKKATN